MPMYVIENPHLETRHFDWSGCRSPSRARRRYMRGFPQRVKITMKPTAMVIGNTIHCHPMIAAELRQALDKMVDGFGEALLRGVLPSLGQMFGGGKLDASEMFFARGGPVKLERESYRVGDISREAFCFHPINRRGLPYGGSDS